MKKLISSIVILLALVSMSSMEMKADSKESCVISVGEELTYEVSFFGVKLGKIKIISEEVLDFEGKRVLKTKVFMNSYDGIPFVDLNSIYESWIHPSLKFSYQFVGNTKGKNNVWDYQKIMMDYDKGLINFEHWKKKELLKQMSFKTDQRLSDGTSLFFLARDMLYAKKTIKIPTILDTNVMFTYINFHASKEKIEIDAIDYPVAAIYFDGRAEWEGVYGLKGKFKGWFSDDDARIPIHAEMNVYVGNVDIDLIEWKRDGWSPPRAK